MSDILLFDELTASADGDAARLIPAATHRMLADSALRVTVESYFAADLNVAAAAKAPSLHPNSLRYRLRRIAAATGRDRARWLACSNSIAAARLPGTGGGTAGLARVIAADVGKCEKVETHVQREGWGTFGGDCRMAGRQLPAGCHV